CRHIARHGSGALAAPARTRYPRPTTRATAPAARLRSANPRNRSVETTIMSQSPSLQSPFKSRYGNFIGGRWVAPVNGRYFENISPINGLPTGEIPRSDQADIELAL